MTQQEDLLIMHTMGVVQLIFALPHGICMIKFITLSNEVQDPVWFSDHCPIEFSIETEQFVFEEKIDKTKFIELEQNFVWTPEGAMKFSQQLGSNEIQTRFQKEVIDYITDEHKPTSITEKLENIFQDIAKNCLTPQKNPFVEAGSKSYCNKWMDGNCFKAKKDFIQGKKEFMKFPDNLGRRLIFMNLKKKCKRIHYQTEQAFRERNLHKIGSLSKKDPKLFWKSVKSLLRDTLQKKGNSIHLNSWKPYFKALLNNIRCSSKTSANAKEQLTQLEEDMQGKTGPMDYVFSEKEIIDSN